VRRGKCDWGCPPVIVLGFDTATPATVVGLRLADGRTLEARDDPAPGERPGHTAQLLPLASELLARARLSWSSVQRIAVGVGPGTFTGLRVGVATARGLAQMLEIDAVGISTPLTLARAALRKCSDSNVLAVIDARRGEGFAAAYGPQGEISAPRALAPKDLGSLAALADERRAWVAVGDGAVRFRAHLEDLAITVPEDLSPLHRVAAEDLCALALVAPSGAPEAVLPDYRRRPDAEIALESATT
jgi:tRNA threonylcarbamoyladenosine biosynthesis protein TsaB